MVYFQFNEVRNDDKEPLDKYCRRLFEFIAGHPVEKLAIDIRWNAGGNLLLNDPLVHGLIRCDKVNKRGKLFVIIGRNSRGAWVAQERSGLFGGLFVNRAQAMKYALFENGNHPATIVLTDNIVELDMHRPASPSPLTVEADGSSYQTRAA